MELERHTSATGPGSGDAIAQTAAELREHLQTRLFRTIIDKGDEQQASANPAPLTSDENDLKRTLRALYRLIPLFFPADERLSARPSPISEAAQEEGLRLSTARARVKRAVIDVPWLVPPPFGRRRRRVHSWRQLAMIFVLVLLAAGALGATVKLTAGSTSWTLPGSVQPLQQVSINFPRSGTVTQIKVRPGDYVRAGTVLATQDETVAKRRLAAAQAKLKADQERLKLLRQPPTREIVEALEQKVDSASWQVTEAELAVLNAATLRAEADARRRLAAAKAAAASAKEDLAQATQPATATQIFDAQASVDEDEAESVQARKALAELSIVAPTSGVVLDIGGTVGALATSAGIRTYAGRATTVGSSGGFNYIPSTPGARAPRAVDSNGFVPLITLSDSSSWQVRAEVPEAKITGLRVGQRATVTVPALGDRKLRAVLASRIPSPIFVGGQVRYAVVFTLESASPALLPGMTATVTPG